MNRSPFAMVRMRTIAAAVLAISPGIAASAPQTVFGPYTQGQAAGPSYLKVRVEDGLVTAEMRNASLQSVLEELAARTGLVFELSTFENEPVTVRLQRVPLREAILRLVAPNHSIFYFGAGEEMRDRIVLVRVFSKTDRSQQPSLRVIGTGIVTRRGGDTVESPEEALRALSAGEGLEQKLKAVEFLVALKGEVAVQALTQAIGDAAPEIRAGAIEGLAGLGVRAALPAILGALKDAQPGVRQSAISAVALLGDYENIKDLRPLAREQDRSVAQAAEIAIKKLSMRQP